MEPHKSVFPAGLTFDDVLLLPGYSDFSRSEIDLSTNLTKKIKLSLPFVSAPMDTVTESKLAVALAQLGGIGIIHRNLSIENQALEVKKVKKQRLLVGAAIGASKGFEERVAALVGANVDVIVVDSAHGFSKGVISTVLFIKKNYPKTQVIAGNIATGEAAQALIKAGTDGLRVGMGPGAICTTRVISGMGVPQITALLEIAGVAKKAHSTGSGQAVPVIADGGIKSSGDMVKALAAGAETVMMGSFFASAEEAPGKTVTLTREFIPKRFLSVFDKTKKLLPSSEKKDISLSSVDKEVYSFKEYRGMGSMAAMKKGAKVKAEDEFHGKDYYKEKVLVAEGVEGLVPIKGSLKELVEQAIGGIRSGMYYVGARTIKELWQKARFIQITQASLRESHPHSVLITNPGENYQ